MRYLTGFTLADGEEKVAGTSGQFLVAGDEVVVLADTRYAIQARREAPEIRDRRGLRRPADALARAGRVDRRASIGVEAGFVAHAALGAARRRRAGRRARADRGLAEADRAVKEPAEIERIAAACAVADRALPPCCRRSGPG